MSESLFSPHWYRVTGLKPRLHSHIEMHRHDYRGLIWYILEDKSSGRSHRFNATAYQFIGLLDGQRTVNQIWDLVNDRLGDYAPTQDEVIALMGKLHAADLLQSGLSPDTEELFQRRQQFKSSKIKQRFSNPLALKIPLWDPEDFLQRQLCKVRWLFHWYIGAIWLFLVSAASLAAALHWQQISGNMLANSLSPYNLVIMVLIYPFIKLLHEFGHAFSAKYYGGEVHEMGVIFLAFMPIPYVDVSTVNNFRSKHQRMLVGAAGILVELLLASLALFLWISAEPGFIRDIAFNIVLIGGISSLFFNGNPLLKYDGYYILVDVIAIPNLRQRSTQYLGYLCQKYLFGVNELLSPATAPGEAGWFVFYSIASFIYRIGVLWVIILYVIDSFFVIGVILAIWLAFAQIVMPLLKGLGFILSNPALQQQRFRAVASSLAIAGSMIIIVFMIPVPSYTRSEGVVWLPEEAQLRTESDGVAGPLLVPPFGQINKATPVVEIHDPLLNTRVEVLYARLKELNTKFRAEWSNDRVKAENIKQQMITVAAELQHAKNRQQATLVASKKAGKLLIPEAADLPGRFLRQGDLIGYVLDDSLPIVRVVVTQADIGQVQKQTIAVAIRLADHLNQSLPASIIRQAPQATNTLPSAALASTGGGKIMIDPNAKDELRTMEKVFHIDLKFIPLEKQTPIGTRVYVRFDHGSETFANQWYRSLRQVFLRQFNV